MVGALSSVRKKKSIPTWLVHDFRTTFRAGVPGLPRRPFLVLEARDIDAYPVLTAADRVKGVEVIDREAVDRDGRLGWRIVPEAVVAKISTEGANRGKRTLTQERED